MEEIIYNKLVRDNIPEIIEKLGKTAKISILENQPYADALAKKLVEEQQEFLKAFAQEDDEKAVLEIVDIVEVCYAILDLIGIAHGDFDKIRENKAAEKGKFENKIFLHKVIDKN